MRGISGGIMVHVMIVRLSFAYTRGAGQPVHQSRVGSGGGGGGGGSGSRIGVGLKKKWTLF